jgi:hypothetical protein
VSGFSESSCAIIGLSRVKYVLDNCLSTVQPHSGTADLLGTVMRDVYSGALYSWAGITDGCGNLADELQQILPMLLVGPSPARSVPARTQWPLDD